MRNPDRIPVLCNALAGIWSEVPDLRLGQLICTLQARLGDDLFYKEDKELIEELYTLVESLKS